MLMAVDPSLPPDITIADVEYLPCSLGGVRLHQLHELTADRVVVVEPRGDDPVAVTAGKIADVLLDALETEILEIAVSQLQIRHPPFVTGGALLEGVRRLDVEIDQPAKILHRLRLHARETEP